MTEQEPMEAETETSAATAPQQMPQPRYTPPAALSQSPATTRNPLLAGFFSLFPGLGNVYNGLYLRGITFFLICFGLIGLATGTQPPEAVLLVFTVIFTWLFNIFDAYRQATLINYGYNPDVGLPDKARIPTWSSGGIVGGVAVFLLGLYGFLRDRFDIDLAVLVDYWYLFFMAFGALLIAQTVLQRRHTEEEAEADEAL